MGFFDKIKSAVKTASEKVGEFAKKTASDFKSFNEKKEAENAEQAKNDAENAELKAKADAENAKQLAIEEQKRLEELAKIEAEKQKLADEKAKFENEKNKYKTKEYLDEHIKSMFCMPTQKELKDELALLHKIGAIDNDNIYVGGSVNFKSKETLLGSFFKKNKDKNFLSYNDGVFYCTYFNHEEKFMVYKYFLKSDVGEVNINKETMEKKIVITEKDGFPLITLDVTDNSKMLDAFEKLLK